MLLKANMPSQDRVIVDRFSSEVKNDPRITRNDTKSWFGRSPKRLSVLTEGQGTSDGKAEY